jgi:hypothetical protein
LYSFLPSCQDARESQSYRDYRQPFTFECKAVMNDDSPPHYEFREEDTDFLFQVLDSREVLGKSLCCCRALLTASRLINRRRSLNGFAEMMEFF